MQINTLEGHNNPVYAVISHPESLLFYTAGNDKGIVEWSLTSNTHTRIFKQVKHSIYCLTIISELNLLVAGCNDANILFFDLDSTQLTYTLKVDAPVFCLKYNTTKRELIASTANGLIMIINPEEKKIIHQFQSGNEKVRSFDFKDDLNILATASNDKLVRLYNLDDYTFIHEFEAHDLAIGSLRFSPDKRYLLTGARDAHLRVWSVTNWACDFNFAAHLFAIYQISYHPFLPYFATASRDKAIKIWRAEDFSLFKNLSIDKGLDGHRLSVNNIEWTADGKCLISVSDDKMVKIWTTDNWN